MPRDDTEGVDSSTTSSGADSGKLEHWNTLFLTDWFRIIMDEAHTIKNIHSKGKPADSLEATFY
jgi:hypothetical protein